MILCLKEGDQEDHTVRVMLDKADITFANLIIFKDHLGYGSRDYYYMKREGNDIATLQPIDCSKDIEILLADLDAASETKVRLLVGKNQVNEPVVNVTPLK
jgi:hypothetical protein